jgi:hypothetical protein
VNEHDDVMYQVRESFSGLRMEMPVENVFARSRARQRRRLSGAAATAAGAAGVAAAVTLTLGGTTTARSGHPLPASPHAKLAAFSVTAGPGDSTTLVLRKGHPLDPSALREALARHGVPALVTVGSFCRSAPAPAGIGQVLSQDASGALEINGRAIPPGTRLSIGYFRNAVRLGLVQNGARLSCGAAVGQPAVHLIPTGAPTRGRG